MLVLNSDCSVYNYYENYKYVLNYKIYFGDEQEYIVGLFEVIYIRKEKMAKFVNQGYL